MGIDPILFGQVWCNRDTPFVSTASNGEECLAALAICPFKVVDFSGHHHPAIKI
jgi:hypothetical protein